MAKDIGVNGCSPKDKTDACAPRFSSLAPGLAHVIIKGGHG
jgi:hypothetical protein